MPFISVNTEPGDEVYRECPECGHDEIFRQSKGFLSGTEYLCNHCGYQAEKSEVKKSYSELKEERDANLEEKLEELGKNSKFFSKIAESFNDAGVDISDPELRQQVEDRQAEGWKIEKVAESGEKVVLSCADGGSIGGHALTGVLTGLWTFGLGNVAYEKLSKKRNKERIVLRTDDESKSPVQNTQTENPIELIRELKELHEEGLITESEFEEKKQLLLDEV